MKKIYQKIASRDPRVLGWANKTIQLLRSINPITKTDRRILKQLAQQFHVSKKIDMNDKEWALSVASEIERVIIDKDGIERAIWVVDVDLQGNGVEEAIKVLNHDRKYK